MDDEDENLTTFLAYTKSPKITKRTSFQDELKKAVSARVSRQQAVEEAEYSDYSEEFESDDSLDDSFGKTKLIQSKKQKDLQNFHFSDTEEDLYGKTSFLKKSKQDKSFSKYSDKSKSSENVSQGDFGESRLADDVKTQHRPDDNERKPIPKPRKSSINSPPSWQGLGISLSDKSFKPTPQHRNLSGKSSHLEDKAEGKRSSDKTTSLSAPSSLMRLNDKVSASMTQSFSERCSPEGDRLSSPPSPTSRFRPLSVAADMNNKTISKEDRAEILKDLQMGKVGTHVNMDSSGSGRKSPSLFEMMISDVKEKSLSQDTKDPFSVKSHEKRPFGEQREDNDKTQQHDKQLDHQKNLKGTLDLGGSQSNRSFSAPQTKKTPKQSTQVSARSRYLGTLAILDTSGNKESGDVEAADMLRATVYQNWLEKKKSFLQELQKTKKAEEQLEKEKARQAFEKWKEAKEDHLKEKILKEKHAEREKKTKEQKAVKEKERENLSAFKKWNDRKEHVLKDKKKQEMYENQKLKSLQAEKEEKDKKAMEVYEQWLERKEWQEKIERKQKKKKVILDSDPPPPWSPPGKTIPAGR
ncbi:microtubule-associated protein 9 isoform X2 [Dendropsophus ebraccatus]|uniref:microtubule-associated protein 9 isoform X2 n=1 Tax=Dendropsophus ebraccatus TaxID=150705 RepID=UPI0038311E23